MIICLRFSIIHFRWQNGCCLNHLQLLSGLVHHCGCICLAVLTHQQFQWGLKYIPGIVHHFGNIWSGTYQYQGISGYSVNQKAMALISADPSAMTVIAKTYPSNSSTVWLYISYTSGRNLWSLFSTYNKYTGFVRFLLYSTSASSTYLFRNNVYKSIECIWINTYLKLSGRDIENPSFHLWQSLPKYKSGLAYHCGC